MSAINAFLLKNNLRIASNPCVSSDFCLNWTALKADVKAGRVMELKKSRFATKAGEFTLVENAPVGKPEKSALGDHTSAGYRQRARFYAVSPEAQLLFAKRIAAYRIFLAENTGLATKERCAATSKLLASYATLDAMLNDISR